MSDIPYEARFDPAPHVIPHSTVCAELMAYIDTTNGLKRELDKLPNPEKVAPEQLEAFAKKAGDLAEKLYAAELRLGNQNIVAHLSTWRGVKWEILSEKALFLGQEYERRRQDIIKETQRKERAEALKLQRQEEFRLAEIAYNEALERARRGEISLASVGGLESYVPTKKGRGPSPEGKFDTLLEEVDESLSEYEREHKASQRYMQQMGDASDFLTGGPYFPSLDEADRIAEMGE